jgi:hypothetical protein
MEMRPRTNVLTIIASTIIAPSRHGLENSFLNAFQGAVHDRATDGTRTCKSKIGEYNKFFCLRNHISPKEMRTYAGPDQNLRKEEQKC